MQYSSGDCGRHTGLVDVDAVIAALGDHYTPERAAIVERMLREYAGTVPDAQLVEEIGLALAINARSNQPR